MTLAPTWQCMASGTDGFFNPRAPWVLNSRTVKFRSRAIAPNQVVCLSGPKAQYPGGGDLLAIDSVSADGTNLTLRRPYKDLNIGCRRRRPRGLTGVTFKITTFDPQIAAATFDIKRRFGIDENITFRDSSWIYDLQDLRYADVLTVLYDRYTAELRSTAATGSQDGAHQATNVTRSRPRAGPLGAVRE